ncbi:outer membrane beta-barrel family protein [Phocaeicola barnesiae]|uniref:outer membrane beta-barrel family protein n=1 Tax=Phocaeicola barnesiae TaxID=376804 RepID=UPI00241DA25A|nr:outer membrane beta-barrel family protein [Phocaeicola barnesiae]
MKQIVILTVSLIVAATRLAAQEVKGRVIDKDCQRIEGATVVMQTPDSVFVDGVVTDSLGCFIFHRDLKQYRLIFQHLLYKSVVKEYDAVGDVGVVVMDGQDYALGEVVISAERPLVKAENGVLTYDVEALSEKTTVSNAYEALTRLPGVLEQGGSLSLIGAGDATVILNGRPSSMSVEQLASLLKSMPVGNVEKAEVMYSAPAKYRVRGAVINLVLKDRKSEEAFVRGEVGAGFTQGEYTQGNGRLNLSFVGRKVSADVLYSADYVKRQTGYDFISHHTLGGMVHDVVQYNTGLRRKMTHNVRASLDYQITEDDNLNLAYTAAVTPNIKTVENSTGTLSESSNVRKGDEQMHNFNLDYTARWGMNVGLDYTYYSYPSVQEFGNRAGNVEQEFLADSRQRINRWNVYAGQTHTLPQDWSLNYGINFSFAQEKSAQLYHSQEGEDMSSLNSDTELDERTYNFYGGLEKAFGERLSLSLSVAGEYYRLAGYDQWAVYPSMQLNYIPSSSHIFQLSLSSDKAYPDYWSMQDATSYINGYAKVVGNPGLRPSTDYTADLTYILKSKYIFSLHYTHVKDLFAQLAYQSPNELTMIYQTVNYDYEQNFGLSVIVPFTVGNIWNSRLTLDGSYFRDVCKDYHAIGFDNCVWRGIAMLNNTIRLSSKPTISLELNGLYVSPSVQGNYDLSSIWKVDAGLKWTSANQKAELRLTGNDLFNSATPDARVNDRGQRFEINQHADSRSFSLSFTYKFGGYKAKEHKDVDTSRFGY